MVYETDFYTTRRPYRASPSLSTYTVSKREIPWDKVPFVPRPSLVPDPITAFGKKKPPQQTIVRERKLIIDPQERAKIKPKAYLPPLEPYVSARDKTREKVLSQVRQHEIQIQDLTRKDSIDVVLPKLHKLSEQPDLPYKRKLLMGCETGYYL